MTLAVVHPGPVLKIYRDGQCVWEIPLTPKAAMSLALDLFTAAMRAMK